MKKMKKLVGILLTLAMVVAMSVTAFAEENGTTPSTSTTQYTITAPQTNHVYEIYQIFTGDLSGRVLSNVKWGVNGTGKTGTSVGDTVLNELTGLTGTYKEKLAKIETHVDLKTTPVATVTNGATASVVAGYYLIKDQDGSLAGQDDTYTLYLAKISADLTIEPKADKPSSEKKVKDVNDTTGTTTTDASRNNTDWIDSADYDIDDPVPFQLTGTVASDYNDYTVYKFIFRDKESNGLTFNEESVKVYVNDSKTPIDSKYYTVEVTNTETETFNVSFPDLKKIPEVQAGSKIRVEYTSTLNANAVLGSAGNPNTMHLEYSNNPNDEQGGETGKTPDDTVIVFTYKLIVNKTKSNGDALAGADFKLEKKNSDETYTVVTRKTTATVDSKGKETPVTDNTAKTATRFTFTGLDDGQYRLTEITTPAGYNTIAPIEFTVTADHKILSDNPALTALNGDKVSGEITFTSSVENGSLSTNIVNQAGTELPETGGMGTTILYVIGAILVIGAGILLVTKKRMNANK